MDWQEQGRERVDTAISGSHLEQPVDELNRVWLLWNDAPAGGIKPSLILFDVELPIAVEVS